MTAFEHDEVTILTSTDGEPIALHDFGWSGAGDPAGPPLLLCHGNGLNAGMWAGALPTLTTRFHCYGLDLRGHGRSRPVEVDYSVARRSFADDVVTAVEAIGGPVHYAAHSLGAASAVVAALHHPEPEQLFTGLWLFEPVLIPTGFNRDGQGPSQLVEMSRRRRMDFDSVADAVERFRSKPPYSLCHPASVEGYVEVGTVPTDNGVRLSCRGEDEARVFETAEDFDFARLASIELPAQVVAGAAINEANALPPRVAPLVAEALGNARWVGHAGLTHFGPMEAPAEMARSIIGFLTDEVAEHS